MQLILKWLRKFDIYRITAELFIYMHIYAYIFIYTQIHLYIQIHAYIHTQIHTNLEKKEIGQI